MSRYFQFNAVRRKRTSGFQYLCLAIIAVSFLFLNAAHAQTPTYVLGTTNLLVGPAVGSNSVVLGVTPVSAAWTNAANASWLHLSPANQSGTGSTNAVFSFDANPGATRSGTLNIAGQTLTVTQAGATYVAAQPVTTLARTFGKSAPGGLAVDGSGNVYMADPGNEVISVWQPANNVLTTLVSNLDFPTGGVGVDHGGNLYIANTDQHEILKWTVTNNSVTTLLSFTTQLPYDVAVDASDNLFIADVNETGSEIDEWTPTNRNLSTLIPGLGLSLAIALDAAGNVYIANDPGGPTSPPYASIVKWTLADGKFTSLELLSSSSGVAVDGSGNVYWSDSYAKKIGEWNAANGNVNFFSSEVGTSNSFDSPGGVAVDAAGNIYWDNRFITPTNSGGVEELVHAFVDPTAKSYSCAAGTDALPVVLPGTANLLAPFTPTSDQPWLSIIGITNGVVSFAFLTNTGPNRGATITLLGQTIPIFQASRPNFLNTSSLTNGPFQLAFSNFQNSSFTVLSSTNPFLPMVNWTAIGTASNAAPNFFEFVDTNPPTQSQQFYRVRSP